MHTMILPFAVLLCLVCMHSCAGADNLRTENDILKVAVLARWATEAYKMGDETVLEFNMADEDAIERGGHIYKPLVTYHEEGQNAAK